MVVRLGATSLVLCNFIANSCEHVNINFFTAVLERVQLLLHTLDPRMCRYQPYTGVCTLGLFWYQEEEPKLLIGLLALILRVIKLTLLLFFNQRSNYGPLSDRVWHPVLTTVVHLIAWYVYSYTRSFQVAGMVIIVTIAIL